MKFHGRIALAALLLATPIVRADPPKVTAVLSNSQVTLGQMVEMDVKVNGTTRADAPRQIAVDGLEIHRTSENYESQLQFGFGGNQNASSVVYGYTVLATRPGDFTIPSQSIRVNGETYQTPELHLTVTPFSNNNSSGNTAAGRGNQRAPSARSNAQVPQGKLAFAELLVTKKSAYVGEMVPVEVRLAFYPQTRARPIDIPEITGQGFTVQKVQAPDQSHPEEINGVEYEVVTYKTAIAAARPGKIDIGPAEANAMIMVPRQRDNGNRPRSPLDIFNMDDPFSDPFFADPFQNFGHQQKVTLKSEGATLDVKPLPKNAPPEFSGAIGDFNMKVEANPKSVQTGDPITVTATIQGKGNFDRVVAPTPQDDRGWHKYPPSSKFQQDDDVGISGTKTFDTVLSPNERKQAVPPFVFAYFNPAKEQYVTLKSDAIPVRVEGANIASTVTPSANAARAASARPGPSATPQAPAGPTDILDQLTDWGSTVTTFRPFYLRQEFWLAQLAPLLALIAFAAYRLRQARLQNREAMRRAALQHEVAELMRRLRRDGGSPVDYFSDASRVVQVKTALKTNADPNAVDADKAAAVFHLNEQSHAELQRLFARSDELRYSGAHNGNDGIAAEQRRAVIDLVESLHA